MTIHVSIGEAEKRLAELVAAALRGEAVVLDSVGARPVMLVTMPDDDAGAITRRTAKRRAAIGAFRDRVGDRDIDIGALRALDGRSGLDEAKFGLPG